MNLCSASRTIFKNASLLYYPEDSFSLFLFTFVSSFVNIKIDERTEETSSIYDILDTFIDVPHYESVDFTNIKNTCEGVFDQIGFTFGLVENYEIYNSFFEVF